ncbi:MAG TPA: MolR family transcriptional regulator, partial [Usitatibacter sp.]|nr:MolR family transcriptional regulator [Usitatibacter sp.]
DFVPLCDERYYLACHEEALDMPAMRRLVELLRSDEFALMVATLPGYSAEGAGRVTQAFEAAAPAA